MPYPSEIDSFENPLGTNALSSPDHALLHRTSGSAVVAVETVLGTTNGTAIAKNFTAGDFATRINSSNVLQQALSGTLNNSQIGTSTVVGGTVGTARFIGGTVSGAVIGTSTTQGGTANNQVVGSPAITGGTANGMTLGTPSINNYTNGTHNHTSNAQGGALALGQTVAVPPVIAGDPTT